MSFLSFIFFLNEKEKLLCISNMTMASFHPSYDFLLWVCVQSMLSIPTGQRFHLFKLLVKYSKALGCLFFLAFLVSLRFSATYM